MSDCSACERGLARPAVIVDRIGPNRVRVTRGGDAVEGELWLMGPDFADVLVDGETVPRRIEWNG